MSTIIVEALESVRFSAPDLAQMRSFLLDFGLVDAAASDDGVLRMRGTGDAQFIHETEKGEPGLVAVALRAASVADLEKLAAAEGAAVEPARGPGGGSMVVLHDPDGYRIEVIAGRAKAAPLPEAPGERWNTMGGRTRPEPKRLEARPARIARLGHVVLGMSNTAAAWEWWRDRFGLIMSDEVQTPDGIMAAAFIRLDLGDQPTDHHSLNFASIPDRAPKFHHVAFEVTDMDDLMVGHEYLKAAERHHDWGVGRHILGSQVFDYWKDPWGHRVEHWTDGDVFTSDRPPGINDIPTMLGHQWGPPSPADFVS